MKTKLMKVLGKIGLSLVAMVALMAAPAYAVNSQDAVTAQADARANGALVLGLPTSQSLWLNLSYSGSAADAEVAISTGTGSTSGAVLSLYAPAASLATDVGGPAQGRASGSFDLTASTVTTMGQLCDLINGAVSGNWHCKLLGSVRSDVAQNTLPAIGSVSAGVNSLNAVGGYSLPVGTNTIMSLGITPAVGRRVILGQCQVNSAATTVNVLGRRSTLGSGLDQQGNAVTDSSLVWSNPLAVNTLSYIPSQYTVAPWLEMAQNVQSSYNKSGVAIAVSPIGSVSYDGHVVVRSSNYPGGAAMSASNLIQCLWMEK